MQLHEWGEESFIRHLSEQFYAEEPFVGIGDDAAVILVNMESLGL